MYSLKSKKTTKVQEDNETNPKIEGATKSEKTTKAKGGDEDLDL